jgi:hypothetical protein
MLNLSLAEKRAKSFGIFDANKVFLTEGKFPVHSVTFQDGMISEAELNSGKLSWDISACLHDFDVANADADDCLTSPEMQADAVKSEQMKGGSNNNKNGHLSSSKAVMDPKVNCHLRRRPGHLRQSFKINEIIFKRKLIIFDSFK